MVSTLISVFLEVRVTRCLVYNGIYTNSSILSKKSDILFGLEWFLH